VPLAHGGPLGTSAALSTSNHRRVPFTSTCMGRGLSLLGSACALPPLRIECCRQDVRAERFARSGRRRCDPRLRRDRRPGRRGQRLAAAGERGLGSSGGRISGRRTDLLLAGQTPFGELLAAPSARLLEAISGCLIDSDDETRIARLRVRRPVWFTRSAGDVEDYLNWAEWMRRHAVDPSCRTDVIRTQTADGELGWQRWSD
jgi:hypothetical protein